MLRRRSLLFREREQAAPPPPPTWPRRWLHLRSTAGGSGGSWADGADATYFLPTDRYAAGTPTRGGQIFGNAANGIGYDNNVRSPHYSGNHAMTSDGYRLQMELIDGPGTYDIWLACGSSAAASTYGCGIQNNGSTILTVTNQALAINEYLDAAGTKFASAAAHETGQAAFRHTFSNVVLLFLRGQSSQHGPLANVSYQRVS